MEKENKMKKGELLGKVLVLATNAHAGQFYLEIQAKLQEIK